METLDQRYGVHDTPLHPNEGRDRLSQEGNRTGRALIFLVCQGLEMQTSYWLSVVGETGIGVRSYKLRTAGGMFWFTGSLVQLFIGPVMGLFGWRVTCRRGHERGRSRQRILVHWFNCSLVLFWGYLVGGLPVDCYWRVEVAFPKQVRDRLSYLLAMTWW